MNASIHSHEETALRRAPLGLVELPPDLLERLKDPGTSAAMHQLLDGVTALHGSGGLGTVFEWLGVLQAFREAASDTLVDNLALFLETTMSWMARDEIVSLTRTMDGAFSEAVRYASSPQAPKNALGMLRMLLRPETVRGLALMLRFCELLQQGSTARCGAVGRAG
jgi:hypothetical protein